jgi:pimeloyl-ACP methyl ester carboxylesterase
LPFIKTRPNLIWHYQVKGKGKPLLFIHGWAGDLELWQQQIDFFSKSFKTIALDLPGHGKSTWVESDLNLLSSDIDFILKKINIEKVTLIVVSLAGLIALKFALMFPEKLERLILVDTAAKFVAESEKDGLTLAQIERESSLLEKDYVVALLNFTHALPTEEERKMVNFKKVWHLLTLKEILPQKKALQYFLNILKNEDLRAILPKIETPTLIISGEKDPICGKVKAEELKAQIPNAYLKFIKNGGHMPFVTQPDIFNRILEDFIINGRVD